MTKNSVNVIGVIPARYGSSRLEGKPLADLAGKTMIHRVYEQAKKSTLLTDLIVATDDERIVAAVKKFGGKVQLTSVAHKTGSDRILEVVENMDVDIVVNIQGDLPLLDPLMIDEAVRPLIDDPEIPMSTLKMLIAEHRHMQNPNVAKVITDLNGFALYFSRAAIPFARDGHYRAVFEHIGLYAYQKKFLYIFTRLPQSPLEQIEMLEQLRVLENGYQIKVVETASKRADIRAFSVDTEADRLQAAELVREFGL